MRRHVRLLVAAFLLAESVSTVSLGAEPNILIIMCDQLTPGVLSCYGGPVPTPHLDRLSARGVVFDQAVCPTPFCSPTRASLITGLYPHSHGITYNVNRRDYPAIGGVETEQGILASDVTLGRVLHEAGYSTHHYGKWHLRGDALPYYEDMYGEHLDYAREMDTVFADVRRRDRANWMDWYAWSLPVTISPPLAEAVGKLGDRWSGRAYAEFITKMGHLDLPLAQAFDVRVMDKTVQRLESTGGKPFLITCSFNYPHDPNVVPSPYYEMFDPAEIALPANVDVREPRFEEDWSRQIVAELGEPGLREFLRIYYASVKLIDDQLGRLFNSLDKLGQTRNTIVVFTADHGDMAGGHGMVWKSTGSFYDEVVRVPMIVSWPDEIQAGRLDVAANVTDLMPTILGLLGREIPKHVQGNDLAPYLLKRRPADDGPLYCFSERVSSNKEHQRRVDPGAPAHFMVRGKAWKYFRYSNGSEYLFHLTTDPGETHNLADSPEFLAKKLELREELTAWLRRTQSPTDSLHPQ